jgi:hypothetical protein
MALSSEFPEITEQLQLQEVIEQSRLQEIADMSKRLIGRGALILGLAAASGTVIGVSETMLEPHPIAAAAADVNDYPDDAKVCVVGANQGQTTGTYDGWCPGYSWGDFIRDSHGNITGNNQLSSRGYGFRNCVDWDALRISELVQVTLPHNLGNGKDWDDNAPSHSYTVTLTPEEGDIAESDAGNFGHVGVVEAVNKDASGNLTSIRVSQYNEAGTGIYSDSTYTPVSGVYWRDAAHNRKWDHFIDVNGVGYGINGVDLNGPPPPPPLPPNPFLIRQGNTLSGKGNLTDMWSTLTYAAADVKASEQRIAIRDTSGNIEAKDGLGGTWLTESGSTDQYAITPNALVIRVGGAIYAKAALGDGWTTVTGSGAVDMQVARNRIVWKDSGGTLWARDGVTGTSVAETSGVSEFDISSTLLLVRQGNTLSGKVNLTDQWTTLRTDATDVQVSANRIAVIDTGGYLDAKDGLFGSWYTETSGVGQYVVTPNLLLVRQAGNLIGKVGLTDLWTNVGGGVADVQAAGNRIAVVDTSGNLILKDGLGGTWVTETTNPTQVALASVE